MFYTLKLFKQQIEKFKPLGINNNPYKHFFKWRKSQIKGANSVKDQQPWISFDAIDYLNKFLKNKSIVFEYGGGGSTLYFLKNQAIVYTVEHDGGWFKTLDNTVKENKYQNWTGEFIQAESGDLVDAPEIDNPAHYSTGDEFYKNHYFKNYATAIDRYENDFFDIVLVDGRSRASCIQHSLSKIKKGGLLILDNSDRTYYLTKTQQEIEKQFTQVLSKYSPSPYSIDFTQTTIWIKNK